MSFNLNIIDTCKCQYKNKACNLKNIIPLIINHESLFNKTQKANFSLNSREIDLSFNTLMKSNCLKIQIIPKFKTLNEPIKRYYTNTQPKKNNDLQDNGYSFIKNSIKFMNIKATFKNKYHTIATQKYCLPHKKYQNINLVLKANFSLNKSLNAPIVDKKEKKEQPTEKSVTKPIDNYEKWLGEWKSKQKQRVRRENDREEKKIRKIALEGSFKVVAFAMTNSILMFVAKLYGAILSHSASMFSEAIHSLADVLNEGLLAWGIIRSLKQPDPEHPYGFSAERYAYALISGVGIFVFGGGVSLYQGIIGLFTKHAIGNSLGSLLVLLFSLISDGASLLVAFRQIRNRAKASGVNLVKYIKKVNDPTTVQVFLEDTVGVAGCFLAGISLLLATYFNNSIIDSIGSIGIGMLLSFLSLFLIKKNINALVPSSLPPTTLKKVVKVLEDSPIIVSVHDVKSVSYSLDRERFKAEIQIDGKKLSENYINSLPNNVKSESKKLEHCKTEEELKQFLDDYGNGLISTLGNEIVKLENEVNHNNRNNN
jgi:zinc transporter 9